MLAYCVHIHSEILIFLNVTSLFHWPCFKRASIFQRITLINELGYFNFLFQKLWIWNFATCKFCKYNFNFNLNFLKHFVPSDSTVRTKDLSFGILSFVINISVAFCPRGLKSGVAFCPAWLFVPVALCPRGLLSGVALCPGWLFVPVALCPRGFFGVAFCPRGFMSAWLFVRNSSNAQ